MSMIDVTVRDASGVAEARRRATAVASGLGFDEVGVGEVALLATELCTNMLKHAGQGRLLVGDGDGAANGAARVDLLALDRGPGMSDVSACLSDGYSSAGTLGHGLGAVRRLATQFHIASWPGRGCAVFARVQPGRRHDPQASLHDAICAVGVPKPGEEVSGDGWSSHADADGLTVFMVDGLGHGTEAAVAANAAVAQFRRSREEPLEDILQAVHLAMRHTRGGAVAVARVHFVSATVTFAGVGNIAGTVIAPSGQLRRMVSHNGTAGHKARKIQAFEYPVGGGPLIMHSDGIATSWTLEPYPGAARTHPMLLAGLLFRDFSRGSDDATVVVARTSAP